jgi:CheY-like chemotaxis protein
LVKTNFDQNRQFDLIFMDIQMPRLDGLQSTHLIREMGYSAPIVALTASAEAAIVEKGMELGIDSFMRYVRLLHPRVAKRSIFAGSCLTLFAVSLFGGRH